MKYLTLPAIITTLFSLSVSPLFSSVSFGSESLSTGKGAFYDELSIGTGYGWGLLEKEGESLSVVPLFVRFGFSLDSLVGFDDSGHSLLCTIEPFVNTVAGDEKGIETGLAFGFRYQQKLAEPLGFYLEASVAPMYYNIDTIEQGEDGFNFLDQFGAGLSCRISDKMSVYGGYRFRHLSHAGLFDRSNDGINTNAIIFGLSLLQ